ncbi:hypothetical protein K402DRAFT_205322 [Aulographum hederae CBS 113979]|uniref:Polycomb protein VEFS-Box domain-containing protein n=1 Tax=Aulographum hederae CBS 113979 TaxID=1176131 RepID=A0A6G1HCC3_9PEZI|nr:hypothetical protein K402DRAFT_205322 [Aulographum hederae CBS 113979]
MVSNYKSRLTGNICVARDIEKYRQGTFLRRNLTWALDHHESACLGTQGRAKSGGSTWAYPSLSAVKRILKMKKPRLKLDVLGLKAGATKANTRSPSQPRKKLKLNPIKCNVELAVIAIKGKEPERKPEPKHRVARDGKILRRRDEAGNMQFDVELEEAFFLDPKQLKTLQLRDGRIKYGLAETYEIYIKVRFMDDVDARAVLPQLKFKEAAPTSFSGAILSARWAHLPKCPEIDQRLKLACTVGGKKYPLDYYMEVDMGWVGPEESVLSTYNRAVRAANGTPQTKPESVTANRDYTMHAETSVRCSYTFKHANPPVVIEKNDCKCPICASSQDLKTWQRLQYHLSTTHSNLQFDIEQIEVERGGTLEVHLMLEMDVADFYDKKAPNSGKGRLKKGEESIWLAPARPFDINKHQTAENWKKTQKQALPTTPRAGRTASKIVVSTDPKDVPGLSTQSKKRYRVPRAPKGMTFFRNTSKMPLKEGDMVSESDDDIDEGWLALHQRQITQDEPGLSEDQKDFMKEFDDHMRVESLSGDIYAGDALVRFVRERPACLLKKGTRVQFVKKVEELRADNIINEAVLKHCIQAAEDVQEDSNPVSSANSPQMSTRATQQHEISRVSGSPTVEAASRKNGNDATTSPSPSVKSNLTAGMTQKEINVLALFAQGSPSVEWKRTTSAKDALRQPSEANEPSSLDTAWKVWQHLAKRKAEQYLAKQQTEKEANARDESKDDGLVGIDNTAHIQKCLCGKPITGVRNIISCSNDLCPNPLYHRKCIGSPDDESDWKCPDCVRLTQ